MREDLLTGTHAILFYFQSLSNKCKLFFTTYALYMINVHLLLNGQYNIKNKQKLTDTLCTF